MPEPLDLESGPPTTAADVEALRALRRRPVPGLLERIDDLSAARQFPHLKQSRKTCAGFEPFTL